MVGGDCLLGVLVVLFETGCFVFLFLLPFSVDAAGCSSPVVGPGWSRELYAVVTNNRLEFAYLSTRLLLGSWVRF